MIIEINKGFWETVHAMFKCHECPHANREQLDRGPCCMFTGEYLEADDGTCGNRFVEAKWEARTQREKEVN